MKNSVKLLFLLFLLIAFSACEERQRDPESKMADEANELTVEADSEAKNSVEVSLINQAGIEVGSATLQETDKGVKISLKADHLEAGTHAFHIHEKGICETPTFESAGGHFNPDKKMHGFKHREGPHAGDMENIEVQEDGTVNVVVYNDRVTLKKGKPHSLRQKEGTSLIIHAEADDYESQPAGNAGDRIVCGVIYPPEKS